jgi:hypothetical protein
VDIDRFFEVEWGYVIDLDQALLAVYSGLVNSDEVLEDRFEAYASDKHRRLWLCPRLIKTYRLSRLPTADQMAGDFRSLEQWDEDEIESEEGEDEEG